MQTRMSGRDSFNVLTNEKALGAVASLISGIISNIANAGLILTGVNPIVSTLVSLQVVGNLLTYFLDIMIAKHVFHGVAVPYGDIHTRFRWFLRSFKGPPFHKFIVACIIEAVIVSTGLIRAREYCDLHKIHFPLRDAVLAGLIAAASFLLIMNVLRFNWVLEETESFTLNVVVMAWMGLSVLVVLCAPTTTAPKLSVNRQNATLWERLSSA